MVNKIRGMYTQKIPILHVAEKCISTLSDIVNELANTLKEDNEWK